MGKVYDALQRAEEQRARRRDDGGVSAPAAPGGAPAPRADADARPARRSRRPLWKRFLRSGPVGEPAGALNKRRIAMLHPDSFVAEQFRTLRARIDALASGKPIRSIAVTSALPGEGKTLCSINLALVTSMSVDRRVLLVDCDLRAPRVHQVLGLHVDAGLAEVLSGTAQPEDAILRVEGTVLDVLPVRSLPANPSELLASQQMSELIQTLAARYDRVVFDVPPVIGLPEARTMCDLCDGIVFVVRADSTARGDVETALDVLDRSRVLGLVLNDVDETPTRYGYNY